MITNSVSDNREQRSNHIVRTFFVDRSVDTDFLGETLLLHGYSVERHQDYFQPDEITDIGWLTLVGERGWAVLTADKRVRHTPIEMHALREHKVRYFCFASNNQSPEAKASLIDKHAAAINEILVCKEPPYIVHLTKERVRLVWPTES